MLLANHSGSLGDAEMIDPECNMPRLRACLGRHSPRKLSLFMSLEAPMVSSRPIREVVVIGPDGHLRKWEHIKAEIIDNALLACDLNVTQACEAIGVGRSSFYRRRRPSRTRSKSRLV
ncbi:helix-turn-helix domain-containing protein [Novosphingobium sp. Gsoil 351]|uniref:helix-turn-helix domain-containing protein n=1 Tax=Novosphingobium sp. Gsoil 351 TaxID=2675225 RepID=UPI0018A83370|nr:helix-turn-helix domain-containing protein [Novosphingobium sp. Gsoil 351]